MAVDEGDSPLMWRHLPYRIQIPLGLTAAVLLTALLVTAMAARTQADHARRNALSVIDRAVALVAAQARGLLLEDDVWHTYALLHDTAQLLPGGEQGLARIAILASDGMVFAASDPPRLPIGQTVLGETWYGQPLLSPLEIDHRYQQPLANGSLLLIDPIRSDDGQTVGFVLTEIDADAFGVDWPALARSAVQGMALSVAVLAPLGWWAGKRMARPVERLAALIGRIGRDAPQQVRQALPTTRDPELRRIGQAIERLLLELERRQAAEQRALSAERLATVGKLTATVAHEINNPLAGLFTATQTLRRHGADETIRQRSVDLIERGLQHIRATVAALLPQARLEARALEPNDVDDILTLAASATAQLNVDVQLRLDIESALRVPAAPLRQVMLNLVLNARKAAGHGGRIEVHLHADEQRLRFVIRNTGARLRPAEFRRLLTSAHGDDPRGFGLWVCEQIAQHLQGRFDLDTEADGVTGFIFEVPNREAPPPQHERHPPD